MTNDSGGDCSSLSDSVARALVAKSSAHVDRLTHALSQLREGAADSSPYAVERVAAESGKHWLAFDKRLQHLQAQCDALRSQVRGLEVLLAHEPFYPLPATSVVRTIAEVAASCAWIVGAENLDERVARSYASLFRDFEKTSYAARGNAERLASVRESLVAKLEADGVRIQRGEKKGVPTDSVAVVHVGRSYAKVNFSYSQRIAHEIPRVGGLYSAMSGAVHGEFLHVSSAIDDPATSARTIAFVTLKSVDAWSTALHTWVGVTPERFYSQEDYDSLIQTIPQSLRDEFDAERRADSAATP